MEELKYSWNRQDLVQKAPFDPWEYRNKRHHRPIQNEKEESPFDQTLAHRNKIIQKVRESMWKKINNRYSNELNDFDWGYYDTPGRFTVCTKQEQVIENLRESNPFGDWNQNKAHVVFDKLFKNSDEHKLRQSKIQKEESIKKDSKLNRWRSLNKINDSLKNIEKMVELAGSQLKNSHKKRLVEESNRKPSSVFAARKPSVGKSKLSFTLKCNKIKGMVNDKRVRKHDSVIDRHIMDILNSSSKSKKDLSFEWGTPNSLSNVFKSKRMTLNPDQTPKTSFEMKKQINDETNSIIRKSNKIVNK